MLTPLLYNGLIKHLHNVQNIQFYAQYSQHYILPHFNSILYNMKNTFQVTSERKKMKNEKSRRSIVRISN